MQIIDAILFEPVGCLAEFAAEEFEEIAAQVFGRTIVPGASGSQAYWDLLELIDRTDRSLSAEELATIEDCEVRAVTRARAYEDVVPALAELNDLGISSLIASSLSAVAVDRFLETFVLRDIFGGIATRDTAGGVKAAPLMKLLNAHAFAPDRVLFLTDTAEGLQTAKQVGVNAILMMNDPDEAMKLTAFEPAGGIVSLHELPDFVRLVAAEHARSRP